MKKYILFIAAILFFPANVYATDYVNIMRIDAAVNIKTPNGEIKTYKDPGDVPEILYGSMITAGNGTVMIKIFNTVVITLESNQGIIIMKNPITRQLEISKIETKSKVKNIRVLLAGYVDASFGPDTRITLYEQFPSIFFGVKYGAAIVNGIEGNSYRITAGDYYEAKQNLLE